VLAVMVSVICIAFGGGKVWLEHKIQDPEYCAGCHVMSNYFETWKESNYTVNVHAELGLVCLDCHSRTAGDAMREIVVNFSSGAEQPLKDHGMNEQQCLRCHVSHEYLASRTNDLLGPDGFPLGRNPHDSHWGPLACDTCHKMHEPSWDFCADCHSFPATGSAERPSQWHHD